MSAERIRCDECRQALLTWSEIMAMCHASGGVLRLIRTQENGLPWKARDVKVARGAGGVGVSVGWWEVGASDSPLMYVFHPIVMRHDTCCPLGHRAGAWISRGGRDMYAWWTKRRFKVRGGKGGWSSSKGITHDIHISKYGHSGHRPGVSSFPFPCVSCGVLSLVSDHGWHPVRWSSGRIILVRQFALVGRPVNRRRSSSTRPAGSVEAQNGDE